MEADPSLFRGRLWINELFDRLEKDYDLLVMITQLSLKLSNFSGKFLVSGNDLPKLNEGPYNEDADFDRPIRVQHAGCHNSAVLGECSGINR